MNNEKNLDINSTPNLLKKERNEEGVKKLNKGPIIFISLALILVLIGLFYASMQRGIKYTDKAKNKKIKNTSNKNSVEKLLNELNTNVQGNNTTKTPYNQTAINVQQTNIQLGQGRQREKQKQKQKTLQLGQKTALTQEQKDLIRLKRQLLLKALTGPTQLKLQTKEAGNYSEKGYSPTPGNSENKNTGSKNNYLSELLKKMPGASSQNNNERNKNFLNQKNSYDYLGSKKTPLISPYELKTGTLIPSVLITGVNSDLPGKITAQVRENVYDTATGNYLLIPQGTRLIGEYSANIIFGQSRLLVAWNRVIFTDGQTLDIGNMLGTSANGTTGFKDQVDNHYAKIFGSASLMSAITAGIQLSSGNRGTNRAETSTDKAISGAVQQLGQVGVEMIRKNMNISPTLNIRPGYRFNIFVTKDIILEPLKY